MTTLYKEVLIESEELVESLPEGTIATFTSSVLTTAAVKNGGQGAGWWHGIEVVSVGPGWKALVPVETEEKEETP